MQISRWVLPRHQYGTRNYMKGDDIDALNDYIEREPELKGLLQVAENIGAVNFFMSISLFSKPPYILVALLFTGIAEWEKTILICT